MARSISASPATRRKSGTRCSAAFWRSQGNWELWTAFTVEDPEDNPPMARWLTLAESGSLFDIEVNASPILAAEMLRRNLWNVAHGCLVTSATLTALGTFERFRMRAGPAEKSRDRRGAEARSIMPMLVCCGCRTSTPIPVMPRRIPPRSFVTCRLVEGSRGTLVLFSSRKQMQDVFDGPGPGLAQTCSSRATCRNRKP